MLNNSVALFSAAIPPVTNSYESIATVTVGSGGSATVSFTSIPTTYKHLQIRGISKTNRVDLNDAMQIQVGNGSVDTAANYSSHSLTGDGANTAAGNTDTPGSGLLIWLIAGNSSTNAWAATVTDILDYADTNKYKTSRTLSGFDNNGNGYAGQSSGSWRSTSAITAITLKPRYGTAWNQYTSFALYGIKG